MSGITPLIDTLLHQVLGRQSDASLQRAFNQPVKPIPPGEGPRAIMGDAQLDGRATPLGDLKRLPLPLEGGRTSPRGDALPSPPGSTQTHFSPAARTIADVLLRFPAPPSVMRPEAPLITSHEAPAASTVATRLEASIRDSGLFYESHLKRWFQGVGPRQQLLNEPQMQAGPRPLVPPVSSGPGAASSPTGMAPLAAVPPGAQAGGQGSMTIQPNMPLVPISADKMGERPGMVTPSFPTNVANATSPNVSNAATYNVSNTATSSVLNAVAPNAPNAAAPNALNAVAPNVPNAVAPNAPNAATSNVPNVATPSLPNATTYNVANAGTSNVPAAPAGGEGRDMSQAKLELSHSREMAELNANRPSRDIVHESLQSLVRQQLEMLVMPTIRWEGDVWAGIFMALVINLPVREEGQEEQSKEGEADDGWRSEMQLDVPHLGAFSATMWLYRNVLSIDFTTENVQVHQRLDAGLPALEQRLSALDLQKVQLRVRYVEAEGAHVNAG